MNGRRGQSFFRSSSHFNGSFLLAAAAAQEASASEELRPEVVAGFTTIESSITVALDEFLHGRLSEEKHRSDY